MSMLVVYVERLVPLWKERTDVLDLIKEARREKRATSVDRLIEERRKIDLEIGRILREAKKHGFDPKAVELIGRETMETREQREERERFGLVLHTYRQELAKDG